MEGAGINSTPEAREQEGELDGDFRLVGGKGQERELEGVSASEERGGENGKGNRIVHQQQKTAQDDGDEEVEKAVKHAVPACCHSPIMRLS